MEDERNEITENVYFNAKKRNLKVMLKNAIKKNIYLVKLFNLLTCHLLNFNYLHLITR